GGGRGVRQDARLAARAHANVREVEADSRRHVAWERPRGSRPGKEVRFRLVLELELHVDRWIFDIVPIAEPKLVAGQRRLIARTVTHDLEPLVEQLLVPELLENPPDALHIGGVERAVGL